MSALLAIDTSTKFCSVAVSNGSEVFSRESQGENSHNEELAELVQAVLVDAAIKPVDLSGIICGSGPGSFTGLRIGLAFAKGMALGLGIPLSMVSSFRAVAAAGQQTSGPIAVIADARREELFFGVYRKKINGDLEVEKPPELISRSDFFAWHEKVLREQGLEVLFSGEDFDLSTPSILDGPKGISVRSLAALFFELGQESADRSVADSKSDFILRLSELAPNYLRSVSARTLAERGA